MHGCVFHCNYKFLCGNILIRHGRPYSAYRAVPKNAVSLSYGREWGIYMTHDTYTDYYYCEDKQNTSFEIHNSTSDINSFYQITTPFQVTYQVCSGTGSGDYLNTITLSEDNSHFMQENMELHNYRFQERAPHFHDFFEIMLILDGTVIQRIEHQDYLYNTGSCCLMNRSLCHMETFSSSARILFLGLSVPFIEELFASCQSSFFSKEREIMQSSLYQFICGDIKTPGQKAYLDFIPTCQNPNNDDMMHAYAQNLIQTMLFPNFGSSYQVKALICQLLQYLSSPQNYHCTLMELSKSSDFLLFSRISHLLEENDGRISRTALERSLNYSGNYLNRIINKYTGMCLFDYGMIFCMKKAEYYLANTDEPIADIVNHLHFSNKAHFYSIFKEKYGMTPNEYRRLKRSGE